MFTRKFCIRGGYAPTSPHADLALVLGDLKKSVSGEPIRVCIRHTTSVNDPKGEILELESISMHTSVHHFPGLHRHKGLVVSVESEFSAIKKMCKKCYQQVYC